MNIGEGKGRHDKAKEAVKRIIDTLTWKDFVSVILFNHGIEAVYKAPGGAVEELVEATEKNKADIRNWCDKQYWAGGATNFVSAFERAFEIIGRSVLSGRTSMCQKTIMFLT